MESHMTWIPTSPNLWFFVLTEPSYWASCLQGTIPLGYSLSPCFLILYQLQESDIMIVIFFFWGQTYFLAVGGIDHLQWVVRRLIFKTTWLPDQDRSEGLMEGVQMGRWAAWCCLSPRLAVIFSTISYRVCCLCSFYSVSPFVLQKIFYILWIIKIQKISE